jgi:hypothetical protein
MEPLHSAQHLLQATFERARAALLLGRASIGGAKDLAELSVHDVVLTR